MKAPTNKIVWIAFAVLCILISLYPIGYIFMPDDAGLLSTKPDELLADGFWRLCFYSHMGFGGVALLLGWAQFRRQYTDTRTKNHRLLGKIYVVSVIISSLAGIYVGFFATGGVFASAGFVCLGVIWLSSTVAAWYYIRNGQVKQHQKMMTISYAACFAAVTLRLWMPLLIALMGDFVSGYRIVAWLCWVPNIIFALMINYSRKNEASNLSLK